MSTPTSPLSELFILHSRRHPDAIAVVEGERRETFETLGRLVGSAQLLIAEEAPTAIGLYSSPSTELIAAAWAALCEGIPYVPLSPTYPEERIRHMISDSGIGLILAPRHLLNEAKDLADGVNVRVREIPSEPSDAEAVARADAGALAYILYTSGSTGTPKGVEIPHDALENQLRWTASELGLTEDARIVHKTPISFDASQWELLANANGAAVIVAGRDAFRDPQLLIETVVENQATHLQVVPTLLQALCEEIDFGRCSSIRLLASGGEPLPQRLAAKALSILPSAELVNLYGPTEATINATFHRVKVGSAADPTATISIGTAVAGVGLHVLDEKGELTSSNVGELAISGVQLARGYRNRSSETEARFVTRSVDGLPTRLYRTGDVVELCDGRYDFRGRSDSQVKIRGHRIELDEIRAVLENHDWVRHAGVVVVGNDDGRASRLIAHIELNPHEAALMDQGVHGGHHQSKSSRLQVRAQIAGLGVREDLLGEGVRLPGAAEEIDTFRRLAFARKTYRHFLREDADPSTLLGLAKLVRQPLEWSPTVPAADLFTSAGTALRSLVQYHSDERLLPKYAYASPGALYGVQAYVRFAGTTGVESGLYYLDPQRAELHLVESAPDESGTRNCASILLVGQRSVITSVYKTNVDEVLHFEAGHLLGLLDTVLPGASLRVGRSHPVGRLDHRVFDPKSDDRIVIGEWEIVAADEWDADPLSSVSARIEILRASAHVEPGVYDPTDERLIKLSGKALIRRKDVIAINQRVHDQASFGLILTSTGSRSSYIELGRALQRVELNDLGIGMMSSGYSSFTGRDLSTARRIRDFDGDSDGSSYFALGGRISDAQISHTGMDEDLLHTQGPAELVATDVASMLPHYMVPDTIRITNALPRTPNGKINLKAISESEREAMTAGAPAIHVAPASLLEHRLLQVWKATLKNIDAISTTASFFALGGTSMTAVRLARAVKAQLGFDVPVQSIFEFDTIAKQAALLQSAEPLILSRAVPLGGGENGVAFLWPGLGGYPMNLRGLAEHLGTDGPRWYGIQSHGLNEGEERDGSIVEMARRDMSTIRAVQPHGPYTLVGYSFGARVAFETAYQLESAGEQVEKVILLAPGSPILESEPPLPGAVGKFQDPRFTRILYSVFFGRTDGQHADDVVNAAADLDTFLDAVVGESGIDRRLAERIADLVEKTYSFTYTFSEIVERRLRADVTIIRASGDDYSFIDSLPDGNHIASTLTADHYRILQPTDVAATAKAINVAISRSSAPLKESAQMPHIHVKHFPTSLTKERLATFVEEMASLVASTFHTSTSNISISMESVPQTKWDDMVYRPDIVDRAHMLVKTPEY